MERAGTGRRGGRDRSLLRTLTERRATGRPAGTKLWAEDESVFNQQLEYLELAADTTRSTIALAFSADGKSFASTHGDHTVKVTSFLQGGVVQTLRGHPRTPWTAKFHPRDSQIVASGCLGFEVRVWNAATGNCLHKATLEAAIISLSFHPSGNMLGIASGQFLYLWDFNNKPYPEVAWAHAHTLRCVRFTPDGCGIIVGAANNSPSAAAAAAVVAAAAGGGGAQQHQHGASARVVTSTGARAGAGGGAAPGAPAHSEVTFRLQIWDFSLENAMGDSEAQAVTNPRVLLEQTLLYNDGGFDLSHDGLWLCAIAELRSAAVADVSLADASTPAGGEAGRRAGAAWAAAGAPAVAAGTTSPPRAFSRPLRSPGGAAGVSKRLDIDRHFVPISSTPVGAAGQSRKEDAGPGLERRGAANRAGELDFAGSTRVEMDVDTGDTEDKTAAMLRCGGPKRLPPASGSLSEFGRVGGGSGGGWGGSGGGLDQAPRHGSQLGEGERSFSTSAVAAAIPSAGSPLSRGKRQTEGVTDDGGRRQASREGEEEEEEDARRAPPALAPWPSRARSRHWFGGAAADQRLQAGQVVGAAGGGHFVAASGAPVPTAAAAALASGGHEPPPHTPSPRIALKRRWSAGGSSGGGSGGWKSRGKDRNWATGSKGGVLDRPMASRRRPRFDGDTGGGGGGGGGSGRVDPGRSPPLSRLRGDREEGRGRVGCERTCPIGRTSVAAPRGASDDSEGGGLRQEIDRPRPPPPHVISSPSFRGLRPFSSSASASDFTPVAAAEQPVALSLSDSISGGLRISPPLQLPRPTGFPTSSSSALSSSSSSPTASSASPPAAGATAQSAGAASSTTGAGASWRHLERRGLDQPFFLQVPPGGEELPRVIGGGGSRSGSGSGSGRLHERQRSRSSHGVSRGGEGPDGWGLRNAKGSGASSVPAGGWGGSRVPPWQPQPTGKGRVAPHLVLVSLHAGKGAGRGAARVVRAAAMDSFAAKQVTSVKLSPSARYVILGAGVCIGDRGGSAPSSRPDQADPHPPVTSIYRASDLQPVNLMPTADGDVNIACFHPEPGMGCIYGTKQGRVCLVRMAD